MSESATYLRMRRVVGAPKRRLKVRLAFKAADLWVGVFWKVGEWWHPGGCRGVERRETDVWICVVPMVPIHLTWTAVRTEGADGDRTESDGST